MLLILLFLMLSSIPTISTSASASFDLSQVKYYDRVKAVLNLTSEQETALSMNGFVVVEPAPAYKKFEKLYIYLVYVNDLPVFVTTDSMLHLFHVVFDCSLKIIEKNYLYPMIRDLTKSILNRCLEDYQNHPQDDSSTYWAIRNATVYFAVADSLATGNTTEVPAELSSDISYYLDHILNKLDFFQSAWICRPGQIPDKLFSDFSQFKVRGHYLGDPDLERYFRCMIWYGFYPVFIPSSNVTYVWLSDARHIDDLSCVYIRDIIRSNQAYFTVWSSIYNVTSAFVGESDSVNFLSLERALQNVFGTKEEYLPYAGTPEGLIYLREELNKPEYQQQILAQGMRKWFERLRIPIEYPTVFQFMGQRYIPDSYVFQRLTFDKVLTNSTGMIRILPKGLDIMAVMGSHRAYQLLQPDFDFEFYEGNLTALTQTFADLNETSWLKSSYTAWMYALSSLANATHSDDYPEFMKTVAWQDEKLNTALGSWAQLRHDTILYAKQPYIPGMWICSYPEAFVEPYPIFYSRLEKLCNRTIEAVNRLELDMQDWKTYQIMSSLNTVRDAAHKLKIISEKELSKEALTSSEVNFIKSIAYLENICGQSEAGWYFETITALTHVSNSTSDSACIADVATFSGTEFPCYIPPQVLHVGTGYVDAIVVLYPDINGTLVASVGPVFSYYEFPLEGVEGGELPRLNDDEWKEMLETEDVTALHPHWVLDIYGIIEPLHVPEFGKLPLIIAFTFGTLLVATLTRFIRKSLNRRKPQK